MGDEVGVEAARRLASIGTVRVEPGLTDHELAAAEAKFGFEFADDHRAFLAAALPVWAADHDDDPDKVSWGWPNWRDLDSDVLRRQVEWPVTAALADIRDGHWPGGWGKRPTAAKEVDRKAERLLARAPRLVPVYAHRYLPAGRTTSGHSVLSVHHLTDIIVYGLDLPDYIDHEFRQPVVTAPFWQAYV
ncbi:hypothetical protein ACIA5D_27045 [Actinoplanes sp. NPDC051513]|uniref:hypothetical protein n=1 Tax=Actinoplanes sp. NPDC051513 TaxID=3363908 RepID=UPI0037BDCB68